MAKPFIAVSKTVDATPSEVWTALTTPRRLKRFFFGSDVETNWKVGAPIRFRGEFDGKPYEDHGEIRSFSPERRLEFSHFSPRAGRPDTPDNYNVVAFELKPHGDKTEVTLSQDKLKGEPTEAEVKQKDQFEKNWREVLDGLAKTVAG
jgi:uncharacterized protein YndB with AHSA1/START domain